MTANSCLFRCAICNFTLKYEEKSKAPKCFIKDLSLLEEVYVIRDPFAEDNLGGVILGSDCSLCKEMVCTSQTCSTFYTKRYCRDCCTLRANELPSDSRSEIQKQFMT